MAIVSLTTIKNWFKTGLKPTQLQFWDTWDSFRHKESKIPTADIEGLDLLFLAKASQEDVNNLTVLLSEYSSAPVFGAFRWIARGTNHAFDHPIAGDIFEGMISPTEFSSALIWNGTGVLNNTNLANFNILNSIEI